MSSGKRFKEWRREKHLTTTQIHEVTGVSTGALSYYENNKREISSNLLVKLHKEFNLDILYILTGEKDINYLPDDKMNLLRYYETCSEEKRDTILKVAKYLSELTSYQDMLQKEEQNHNVESAQD